MKVIHKIALLVALLMGGVVGKNLMANPLHDKLASGAIVSIKCISEDPALANEGKYLEIHNGKYLKWTGKSPYSPTCQFIILKSNQHGYIGFRNVTFSSNLQVPPPGQHQASIARFENGNFSHPGHSWEHFTLVGDSLDNVQIKSRVHGSLSSNPENFNGAVQARGVDPQGFEQYKIEVITATPSSDFEVVGAVYGDLTNGKQKTIDATEKLQAAVENNAITMINTNSKNSIFGDPSPGVYKSLMALYYANGQLSANFSGEYLPLALPVPNEAQASHNFVLATAPLEEKPFELLGAFYGNLNVTKGREAKHVVIDVTEKTKALVADDGMSIVIPNAMHTDGGYGDPIPGIRKGLIVFVNVNGKIGTKLFYDFNGGTITADNLDYTFDFPAPYAQVLALTKSVSQKLEVLPASALDGQISALAAVAKEVGNKAIARRLPALYKEYVDAVYVHAVKANKAMQQAFIDALNLAVADEATILTTDAKNEIKNTYLQKLAANIASMSDDDTPSVQASSPLARRLSFIAASQKAKPQVKHLVAVVAMAKDEKLKASEEDQALMKQKINLVAQRKLSKKLRKKVGKAIKQAIKLKLVSDDDAPALKKMAKRLAKGKALKKKKKKKRKKKSKKKSKNKNKKNKKRKKKSKKKKKSSKKKGKKSKKKNKKNKKRKKKSKKKKKSSKKKGKKSKKKNKKNKKRKKKSS